MKPTAADPITLEVVRNKLDAIAEEMEAALIRSAYSSIVKEGHDASAGLFNARGEMIAQATALPAQLGALTPAVRRVIDLHPVDEMVDGDIFILNDPYDGGTHLPDIAIIAPVMHERRVVAFAATIAHHQDVGGKTPGSIPTDATEIFQEGLRIPPLRLYHGGKPDTALHALLERNVRIPDVVRGDLRAQLAAAHVGKTRLFELVAVHGAAKLDDLMNELLHRAEAITRKRIGSIADGEYTFCDYLDSDGIDIDKMIKIQATVIVSGTDITFDFTGTDAQAVGPVNADTSAVLSAVFFVVRALAGPHAPGNGGCYRPAHTVLPAGTIVNPLSPAPVNGRTITMKRICDVLLGALVQALPGEIPAAPSGLSRILMFGGIEATRGQRFVCTDLGTGGSGGQPYRDGIDAIHTDIGNTSNVPAEALELNYPLRVWRSALWNDSAGAGRQRGGLGVEKEIEVTAGELILTIREDRHRTRPWGLFGGLPAPSCIAEIHRADGGCDVVPSKGVYTLRAGDRIHCWGSGGAGYGDPLERPPDAVLLDVLDRRVSAGAARELYGVCLTSDGGTVDVDETLRLRSTIRADRGAIEWTYDRGEMGREP